MWTNLRLASGAKRSMPTPHPHPHSEANRLALSFATHCSSTQLPASVSRKLQQLKPIQQVIQIAIDSPAQSDTPFTLNELEKATKTSKDTTPGIDKIPYSMLHHLGPSSMGTLLRQFNAPYHQGTLPQAWKSANLIPIPKCDSTNAFRPISLLSCIGKTMERAVLHRLQYIIPSLHPHIFAYEKGTGTADNIATLLSLTDGNDSVIVFLDLEKAFELANHDAILHALAEKGVKGKLLKWVKDYLSNRKARVRFQGHTSDFYPFENGTPQGGLLGPFLFNLLIVKLVEIPFPNNTHLLAYADDLQLVVTGTGNLPLDWVNSHKCLAIFFNENLSSTAQLRRLLLRSKLILNVMRRLTSSKLGPVFRTLRLFYTHAVRSLIDYSAPALLTLSPQDFVTLETIQNRAMRDILAAPRWTRLANLRMESFLPSLKCRIHQLTAGLVAKILSRSRPSPLKHITANLLYPNELDGTTSVWHASLIKTPQSLNAIPMIISRGMDASNSHYVPKPPWAPQTIKFHTDTLPTSKALCTKEILNNVRHLIDSLHQPQNLIFTDGSIDQSSGKAGAAMAELYAIKLDLTYALTTEHTIIHILTDSLSAVYALQKTHHLDNVHLLTTILFKSTQLENQGKSITFRWIPSHVNILGNDQGDLAAKQSLSQDHTIHVSTRLNLLKRTLRKTTFAVLHIEHWAWVHAGSPSALWYKLVTDYNPPFATATSRQSAAIFHRLRMGYRCNWEIYLRTTKACQHCDTVTNEPLLHYILDCTHIRHLRSPTYISSDRRDHSENLRLAACCLWEMFETPDALTTFTANPPPR
ncbi:uncharacterized protein [Penaeus vannamei]|uniref:uncharacterized protein n=1 Tax=Penaeus vannamei TaxID=6689 RepID=UPI00387F6FC0